MARKPAIIGPDYGTGFATATAIANAPFTINEEGVAGVRQGVHAMWRNWLFFMNSIS